VLLPVVFLLGIAAYARLVQINTEEFQLVLAMNRLRRAYLTLEPGLERYLTTGHHDDEQGVIATYMYRLDPCTGWIAPPGSGCGSTSWSTPRPWCGGRCSGCSCTPCVRSATRHPGSPPRRTDPEDWLAALRRTSNACSTVASCGSEVSVAPCSQRACQALRVWQTPVANSSAVRNRRAWSR
jgi:hypothetical protein